MIIIITAIMIITLGIDYNELCYFEHDFNVDDVFQFLKQDSSLSCGKKNEYPIVCHFFREYTDTPRERQFSSVPYFTHIEKL